LRVLVEQGVKAAGPDVVIVFLPVQEGGAVVLDKEVGIDNVTAE